MLRATFRSLAGYNYRLWAAGALVSNVGTWMQRTTQDWIVFTELTRNDATAVGFVLALQFGPSLLLLPLTGFAADHLDRRRLLIVSQSLQAVLALALGILVITGTVQLWHVYTLAFLLGCVTAFDAPARQTFVADIVSDANLSNAVALNSTSFQIARMVGPAMAGLLIAGVGAGWEFLINAATFGGCSRLSRHCAVTSCIATSARRASPTASSKASATCEDVPTSSSCSRCSSSSRPSA